MLANHKRTIHVKYNYDCYHFVLKNQLTLEIAAERTLGGRSDVCVRRKNRFHYIMGSDSFAVWNVQATVGKAHFISTRA